MADQPSTPARISAYTNALHHAFSTARDRVNAYTNTLHRAFFSPSEVQDQSMQPSPAKTFMASLPIVKPENLPEDSQSCHICKELYDNPDPEAVENAESPMKLACSHVMGSECLARWFEGNNSCPVCRATLFEEQSTEAMISNLLVIPRQLEDETMREHISMMGAVLSNPREVTTFSEHMNDFLAEMAETGTTWDSGRAAIDAVMARSDARMQRLRGRSGGAR